MSSSTSTACRSSGPGRSCPSSRRSSRCSRTWSATATAWCRKTELLDEIWGDRFVSESALTSRIKSARQAIGDNGRDQRLIRTVHGRGFRFVGEVLEADDASDDRRRRAIDRPHAHAVVVDRSRAGHGTAIEVVGPSGAAAAVRAARGRRPRCERGDLLVGRAAHGRPPPRSRPCSTRSTSGSSVAPSCSTTCRRGAADELRGLLGGGEPSSRQRLIVAARELLAAAGRRAVRSSRSTTCTSSTGPRSELLLDQLARTVRRRAGGAARRQPSRRASSSRAATTATISVDPSATAWPRRSRRRPTRWRTSQ